MREEPIYTESDMQIARNALAQMKKERDDCRIMFWCAVKSVGGKMQISQLSFIHGRNFLMKREATIEGDLIFQCLD